ncbi:YbaY family lipoprotein [Providencia sneebia]|uniref:Lipoprotein n=1 Tax=Providencia sneebia DSM 19967 TaxID=1141660 RepID=K8W7R7_9GAMM|nr:YbaY family lipoprotein [Providencia sneebia]EKT53507.1 hypothetical protein OO7_14884 [Providencia sneebia DSM 19967]
MKLYRVIMCFIILALLSGCEGNNNKPKEKKLGSSQQSMQQNLGTDSVSGQIVILQHAKLPEDALLTVTLADESAMIGLPVLILSQKYYDVEGKQSPFPFELSYQQNEVRTNAHLTVGATISVGDKILFASEKDSDQVVINNGVTQDIKLVLFPIK